MDGTIPLQFLNEHLNFWNVEKASLDVIISGLQYQMMNVGEREEGNVDLQPLLLCTRNLNLKEHAC